jgi:LemA protein
MSFPIIFCCILGFMLGVVGVQSFNALVSLKNQVERAWANIDVILKQRFDEIPQLVQVIEQFAQYERGTIEKVVEARTRYSSSRSINDKIKASGELSVALRGVLAIGEAYPELTSNKNFVQLQTRISELENSIADRRESYNDAVTNYNTRIHQFPDMMFAGPMGYREMDQFHVSSSEKIAPVLKMKLPGAS